MAARFARSFGFPVASFAAGWGGYSLLENQGVITPAHGLTIALRSLQAQRYLYANVITPMGLSENESVKSALLSGHPDLETLDSVIDTLVRELERAAKGDDDSSGENERVPFIEILRECRNQEQFDWLVEHVEEDIPYFYISDIFHAWLQIHYSAARLDRATTEEELPSEAEMIQLQKNARGRVFGPPREIASYEDERLCVGLWNKVVSGVIPYDVGSQAIALLATSHPANARTFKRLGGVVREVPVPNPEATEESSSQEEKKVAAPQETRVLINGLSTPADFQLVKEEGLEAMSFAETILRLERDHGAAVRKRQDTGANAESPAGVRELSLTAAASAQTLAIVNHHSARWWNLLPLGLGSGRQITRLWSTPPVSQPHPACSQLMSLHGTLYRSAHKVAGADAKSDVLAGDAAVTAHKEACLAPHEAQPLAHFLQRTCRDLRCEGVE